MWDGHIYLWLTRSGRQATCSTCREAIGKWKFRLIYSPHPKTLPASRKWSTVLWRYYHVDRGCVRDLPATLVTDYAGSESSSASTATFLESRGWALQQDVAPMPKAAKESDEARRAAVAEQVALVNREFAALA